MATATLNFYVEGLPANEEAVQLELTDGEKYVSRKFAIVDQVIVCLNTDSDNHINATISGATITVNAANQTNSVVSLVLYGVPNK